MQLSTERILTTHVGSLPRPPELADMLIARETGGDFDDAACAELAAAAVRDVVAQQVDAGIDIVSDGEVSKVGYATYIKDRCSGFSGDSPRRMPQDLEMFPGLLAMATKGGQGPRIARPVCTGEIAVVDDTALTADIANFTAALAGAGATEGFMNAASPGVIAAFLPNEYYPSEDAYLERLATVMKPEYDAIVAAGLVIQLDCPDLAMARHMQFKDLDDAAFVRTAHAHVEVLNAALADVPADMARLHLCWGNYEGPHVCDIGLDRIADAVVRAKPQVISFEASNPRHAHEWSVWREVDLPDDKVLMPGVIDSVSNFVEHPAYVAEKICRFADIVGRERVLAGSDCGFDTFAGYGKVAPDVVYAKFRALAEGAALASARLW